MTTARKITREEVKDLIDCVPTDELLVVKRYIQYIIDIHDPAFKAFLDAPVDDEPITEADKIALQEAREDIAAGRLIPAKELYKELGL